MKNQITQIMVLGGVFSKRSSDTISAVSVLLFSVSSSLASLGSAEEELAIASLL